MHSAVVKAILCMLLVAGASAGVGDYGSYGAYNSESPPAALARQLAAEAAWFPPASHSGSYGAYGAYGARAAATKSARKLLATAPLSPKVLEHIFTTPGGAYGQYGNGQYGQ